MKFKLTNVKEYLKNSGGSRRVTNQDIKNLRPGYFVKVCLEDANGGNGETVWLQVYGKVKSLYKGELKNQPVSGYSLNLGDFINFRACNIVEISAPLNA